MLRCFMKLTWRTCGCVFINETGLYRDDERNTFDRLVGVHTHTDGFIPQGNTASHGTLSIGEICQIAFDWLISLK